MAFFNIRQWIDRVSQFPNRRTLTNVEDPTDVKTYDLDRAEGDVSVRGTAITGANLTDLENRIGAAFTAVENAMPEANPAQEATGSLTKLKVDGTVYEVEGGGGGEPQTGTIEDVAMASFSDGADDVPVSELIVDIEARQEGSGDPSPDNVREILGFDNGVVTVCGVNLWDEQWEVGAYNNTTGEKVASNKSIRSANKIPIKPNTTYYGYYGKLTDNLYALFYDINGDYININDAAVNITRKTFTTPNNAYYMAFRTFASGVVTDTYENNISINYPSSDTDYHSYIGNTYTVDFGQTVYGGFLNVTTGELTITSGRVVLDGSSDEQIDWSTNNSLAKIVLSNAFITDSNSQFNNYVIADKIESASWADRNRSVSCCGLYFGFSGLFLKDTNITDVNTARQWLSDNNLEVIYKLATPITVQLTPTAVRTLLGNNNIFADTGNIEKLVYFKTGCEAIATLIEAYSEKDGTQTVLLEATDWDTTTNTITVAVTGVTATSNQEILPLPATSAANIANNKALQACNLMDYGQAVGQITLYAENIPSVDLSIRVIVRA